MLVVIFETIRGLRGASLLCRGTYSDCRPLYVLFVRDVGEMTVLDIRTSVSILLEVFLGGVVVKELGSRLDLESRELKVLHSGLLETFIYFLLVSN